MTTAPLSASEFAALELRRAILDGRFKPGSRIQQHQVAAGLGVSHVPLREAMQRLEAEGFIAIHPRRGAFVMPLSRDDAAEIFELRIMLERRALELSLPCLTDEQIQLLKECCAAADGVTDVVRYGELNVQFHRALYAAANKPRLLAMIESLWLNASRYAMLLRVKGGHFEQSQLDHWDLLEAAVNRDVAAASSTFVRHIETAGRKVLSLIEKTEQDSQTSAH